MEMSASKWRKTLNRRALLTAANFLVVVSVGTIRKKLYKKSESDSFGPAGKTRIDSDSIPSPTIRQNSKKDSRIVNTVKTRRIELDA
jgi:hypothetical protein